MNLGSMLGYILKAKGVAHAWTSTHSDEVLSLTWRFTLECNINCPSKSESQPRCSEYMLLVERMIIRPNYNKDGRKKSFAKRNTNILVVFNCFYSSQQYNWCYIYCSIQTRTVDNFQFLDQLSLKPSGLYTTFTNIQFQLCNIYNINTKHVKKEYKNNYRK